MTDSAIGLREGTLAFKDYQAVWARAYAAEASLIAAEVPDIPVRLEHIGSTAVPGLMAKPIIDIGASAALSDFDRIANALAALGYVDRGERSGRLFVRRRNEAIRTHNLHLYAPNSAEFAAQIAFRDALREDKALRRAYAAEKRRIHAESGGQREGYADAKTNFIVTALARLNAAPEAR